MSLNKAKGNMFDFITHTWNPIAGICPYDCAYCYMKKLRKQYPQLNAPLHYNKDYLQDNLGQGNFIFIGSSTDIFSHDVKNDWLLDVFCKANWYDNQYLLQTKNPLGYHAYFDDIDSRRFILSTTIESNNFFYKFMGNTEYPSSRALAMKNIFPEYRRMVTVEPIMDFDLTSFIKMLLSFGPEQINIGADTGNNNLPEPSAKKIMRLIKTLKKETKVVIKPNLKRIIGIDVEVINEEYLLP